MLKELKRKAMHILVGSGLLAVSYKLYTAYGFSAMHFFLLCITLVSVIIDVVMVKMKIFLPIYKQLQRKREKRGLHHHTLALFSIIVLLQFIDTRIVAASTGMLVFGDAAAAVVGTLWGKHKISKTKTLEGSLAMLCFSILAGSLVLGFNSTIIIMAIAATLAEAYSTKISDSITIPFAAGIAGQITSFIL